jgi:hypothetical protein
MKHGVNIEAIEEIIDSGLSTKDDAQILKIFLAAVNDWPVNCSTLEEYADRVEETIRSLVTKQSLKNFLAGVDFQKHAWQAESITQLLQIYEFYDERKSLKEIINDLGKPAAK